MIKTMVIGLWVCGVTLVSVYFGATWEKSPTDEGKASPIVLVKMKPLTVPVVGENGVEGYLVAMIGYNVDKSRLTTSDMDLGSFLMDQSFRALYGIEAIKYKKPRKSDLAEMSSMLLDVINKKLGSETVTEVLIEELSFIPKESARSGRSN